MSPKLWLHLSVLIWDKKNQLFYSLFYIYFIRTWTQNRGDIQKLGFTKKKCFQGILNIIHIVWRKNRFFKREGDMNIKQANKICIFSILFSYSPFFSSLFPPLYSLFPLFSFSPFFPVKKKIKSPWGRRWWPEYIYIPANIIQIYLTSKNWTRRSALDCMWRSASASSSTSAPCSRSALQSFN